MTEISSQVVIDARNEPCPKPILLTKRAVERAEMGTMIEIIVNEHTAKDNVLRYCWNHGQEIVKSWEDGADFHLLVRRSPEKMADRPLPAIGPCGQRWD
jgi:TusA-related sulfurtransferase